MDKPCVVMVGNLTEGWKAFGPFESFEKAAEWCAFDIRALAGDGWVMTLEGK